MSSSLYSCPTIDEIFGLNNPLPIIKRAIPRKKNESEKYSKAIEPWPSAIISAPITVAFL